jgi:hypothetical protein
MENRNGLVVAAEAILATGAAERKVAARLSERLPEPARGNSALARASARPSPWPTSLERRHPTGLSISI